MSFLFFIVGLCLICSNHWTGGIVCLILAVLFKED